MNNIVNYIKYRSDILFSERPFNEIDALVFSALVYFPFEHIVSSSNEEISLFDACHKFSGLHTEQEIKKIFLYSPYLYDFFLEVKSSKRYKNVMLSNYQVMNDQIEFTQFAAMLFKINDKNYYVAYRGTDNTVLGWQENLKMLYQQEVKSYEYACDYLNKCVNEFKGGIFKKVNFFIGGHSKGGNLSMAAYIKSKHVQNHIVKVYNFDGPGFSKVFIDHYGTSMFNKIIQYVPNQSIVGRMFEHPENIVIIDSYQEGIAQHDLISWKVHSLGFDTLSEFHKVSNEANDFFNELIYNRDDETKQRFAMVLNKILSTLEVEQLTDLKDFKIQKAFQGLIDLRTLKSDERKFLLDLFLYVLGTSKNSILNKN